MARPRKHESASARADASRIALVAAGGARREFRLSPHAIESLAIIRELAGDATDTALIERLLDAERVRLTAPAA
jgi:hypothetical protein